jgi:tRNA(adenine34) deaminase
MELSVFSDKHFMKEAIKEAQKAFDADEVPIGHAEMQAFTAASNFLGSKYLDECTLYVTLEPCIMCAGASLWTQIDKIVYGADDEEKGFTRIKQPIIHPKTKVSSGVLEKECSGIIKEFFRQKR